MTSGVGGTATNMKFFDAHCHLQDSRIISAAPAIIRAAAAAGVRCFVVNGTHENDWHIVKKMAEDHLSVVPSYGLHPWFVAERSPNWIEKLKELLATTPAAAVGEIGIDKGSRGSTVEFSEQIDVFRQQLDLAKDLNRPVSVHCVRAFRDLLETLQCYILQHLQEQHQAVPKRNLQHYLGIGSVTFDLGYLRLASPFPAGVILHSYMGSAEMVTTLVKHDCYFSFSGYLLSMKMHKAKEMLRAVPFDRILLETDAPDALPKTKSSSSLSVKCSTVNELLREFKDLVLDSAEVPEDENNHPANIRTVLNYVATLLEMPEEELAEISYRNAIRLFSYPGSKVSEGSMVD